MILKNYIEFINESNCDEIDLIEIAKKHPYTTDTETSYALGYKLSDEMVKELNIKKVKEEDIAQVEEIHFDAKNILVAMYGKDENGEMHSYDDLYDYKEYDKYLYSFSVQSLPKNVKLFIIKEMEKDIRANKSKLTIKKYNM